jgi:hypothetical protein
MFAATLTPDNYSLSGSATYLQLAQDTVNPRQAKDTQAGFVKRLAITHGYTLQVPNADIEDIQQRHLSACSKLGCTVVNTVFDRAFAGRITARSEVRIAPDAFAAFVDILAAAPGQIVTHTITTEDKTVPMLDVEKRLEVKTALRDRLSAMLREPGPRSSADLATIEKELAEVQGDIEGIVAQRDYLRTITETVRVNISYIGLAAQAGGVDLSPISRAGSSIGATLVESIAVLISFLAAIVPWLPLLALLAWAARRALRRWRARGQVNRASARGTP